MPNTPVRAAAEGMPNVNRRRLLNLTGAGLALAATAMATKPSAAAATSAELEGLIAAKHKAVDDFEDALTATSKLEEAYFQVAQKELFVPLSIGGAQSFNVQSFFAHFDIAEHYQDVRKDIGRRYQEQHHKLAALTKVAPTTAVEAATALQKAEAHDLRTLRQVLREEVSRRKAAGLWQAKEIEEAASDADMDAFTAICAYRCTTLADVARKAEALAHFLRGSCCEIQDEDLRVLLSSMMPADDEGGAS